jgi:hypothetical protein
MKKVVIIEHCKTCPHSTYITTIDPKHPRIYLGCHLAEPSRSFDFPLALSERPQIPEWCPLPDAEEISDKTDPFFHRLLIKQDMA